MMNLIDAIKTIKNECRKHLMCKNCPIYNNDKGCLVEPLPCDWEIRDSEDLQKGGV